MRRVFTLTLITLLLLLCFEGRAGNRRPATTKPIILKAGVTAPDFTLQTPQGKSVRLGSFRGKPVLITFWATWCRPCVEEMPILQQTYTEWSEKGLTILGINAGDPVKKVTGFIQRYGITFPIVIDGDQEVARLYSVRFMPTNVLLDKDRVILAVGLGGFDTKEHLVTNMLSRLGK